MLISLNIETRRLITDDQDYRINLGTEGDVGADPIVFTTPYRIANGVTISDCDAYVVYKNLKSGVNGVESISNLTISGKTAEFVWQPCDELFLFPGIVKFSVWLIQEANGKIAWSWNSRTKEGMIWPRAFTPTEAMLPSQIEKQTIVIPSGLTVTEVD